MKRLQMLLGAATVAVVSAVAPPVAGAYPASGLAAVTAQDQVTPLRSGGSATFFSLSLPPGAHCAGDTAHQGYQLYSFLIPAGVDPHQEDFATTLPAKWYGMYTEIQYYVSNLAPDTGQVLQLPADFTWSRLSPSLLIPSGSQSATWSAGLACVTEHDVVENYWTAGFEFARSTADPGGFTFRVVSSGHVHGSGGGSYWLGLVPFGVAAGLVGATFGFRRLAKRPRRPVPTRHATP